MEKLTYLLFDEADASGTELRRALIEKTAPALREGGGREICIHVQDDEVAAGTPMPKSSPPIRAMVSFWLENSDDRRECEAALAARAKRVAGYLVVESRPLVHERPLGQRTPGSCQVTCISRRRDISYEEFTRIWHGDHRQVALETQSTSGYVRNEFLRPLTEGAPDQWIAIVEETFPIAALTDPLVFYDAKSKQELDQNLSRMMESCERFLDMEPLEFTHMSEYYLG